MSYWQEIVRNWKSRKGWILFLLFVLFFITVFEIVPWGYHTSAPIRGRIIDAETKEPIQGALLSISWPMLGSTLAGVVPVGGNIMHKEAVSDERGEYIIPGWKVSMVKTGNGGFRKSDPELFVYKPGYWTRVLRNEIHADGGYAWGEPWRSDWDGKVIELEPMHWREWTKEEWETNLAKMKGSAISFEDCNWVNYPEVIVEDLRFSMRRAEVFQDSRWANWGKYWHEESKKCGVSLFPLLEKQGFTRQEWETCCKYDPSPVGVVKISKNPDGTYSRSSVHANPIIRAAPPGVTDTGKNNGHGSEEAGKDHVER